MKKARLNIEGSHGKKKKRGGCIPGDDKCGKECPIKGCSNKCQLKRRHSGHHDWFNEHKQSKK